MTHRTVVNCETGVTSIVEYTAEEQAVHDAAVAAQQAEAEAQAIRLIADADLYKDQKKAEAIRVIAEAQAWALSTKGTSLESDGAKFAQQSEILLGQVDALHSIGNSQSSKLIIIPSDLVQTVSTLANLFKK